MRKYSDPYHSSAAASPNRADLVAIIITHTTRHLRLTLLGLAQQTRKPDRIIISCDNDAADIRSLVQSCAQEFNLHLTLVQRPHAGLPRASQVRNNAVRALIAGPHDPNTRLVFFDGDILTSPYTLDTHESRLAHKDFVIAHRFDLNRQQTESIDERSYRFENFFKSLGSRTIHSLSKSLVTRELRYRRQLFFKRFGLCKPHKPKILSANFGITLPAYLAINGFDERFEGYGQEDDDLGRRLYQAGFKPAVGILRILNFHLYHPTRAPQAWNTSPAIAMLHADAPAYCIQGVNNPKPPNDLRIFTFTPSPTTTTATTQPALSSTVPTPSSRRA